MTNLVHNISMGKVSLLNRPPRGDHAAAPMGCGWMALSLICAALLVTACAPKFNKKVTGASNAVTNNKCAVQSPGTSLSCPVHVDVDTLGGTRQNVLVTGQGSNQVHVVCRGPAAGTLCSHVNGTKVTTNGADGAGAADHVYTLFGTGWPVNSGDGSAATSAGIYQPSGTAVDSVGNVVVADRYYHTIRVVCMASGGVCPAGANMTDGNRITPDASGSASITLGNVYHFAGVWPGSAVSTNPNFGYGSGAGCAGGADNVMAYNSCLSEPHGVAVDGNNNVIIADTNNNRVRIVCMNALGSYCSSVTGGNVVAAGGAATAGKIYTLAGGGNVGGPTFGDGAIASSAKLNRPIAVAKDSNNNVAIADGGFFSIRVVCAGGSGLCQKADAGTGTLNSTGAAGTARFIYTAVGYNAGTRVSGDTGDGSQSFLATTTVGATGGVGFDSNDNLVVSDTGSSAVRIVCNSPASGFCLHQSSPVIASAGAAATPLNIYLLAGIGAGFIDEGFINSAGYATGSPAIASIAGPTHATGYATNGHMIVVDRDNDIVRFVYY